MQNSYNNLFSSEGDGFGVVCYISGKFTKINIISQTQPRSKCTPQTHAEYSI